MGPGMCRRGLLSDGSLPETVFAGRRSTSSHTCDLCGERHEHTVKRSAFATIPAETRPFLIIAPHPSLLLVALPCDSWLESCST